MLTNSNANSEHYAWFICNHYATNLTDIPLRRNVVLGRSILSDFAWNTAKRTSFFINKNRIVTVAAGMIQRLVPNARVVLVTDKWKRETEELMLAFMNVWMFCQLPHRKWIRCTECHIDSSIMPIIWFDLTSNARSSRRSNKKRFCYFICPPILLWWMMRKEFKHWKHQWVEADLILMKDLIRGAGD
jgi:hypothetical protein